MKRICHISSVHAADDVRIFHKECSSLALESNWEVHLVGNGPLDVGNSNVHFHALPIQSGGRIKRMVFRSWLAYSIAKNIDADIYHIHDPELLPFGLLLKRAGKSVIYDAHEDLPRDILTKSWIPLYLRKMVSFFAEIVENFVARRLDIVIAATPYIRDRFLIDDINSETINNYPILNEFKIISESRNELSDSICYTGGIMEERGIFEMLEVLPITNLRLRLAGAFAPKLLREQVVSHPSWPYVIDYGFVKREHLAQIFCNSIAGLVLFHPIPNHVNSQPNKLFEYMSAGLPVVASNFLLWKDIIETINCGLCVDPLNPIEIAEALIWLHENPHEAKAMGERGAKAIRDKYNWEHESLNLINIYNNFLCTV